MNYKPGCWLCSVQYLGVVRGVFLFLASLAASFAASSAAAAAAIASSASLWS